MRFLIYFSLIFGAGQLSFAQSSMPEAQGLIPLENGYFLEVIPEKYVTVTKPKVDIEDQPLEWVTIPAVFETVTETKILQDAYMDLDITPAVLAGDGSVIDYTKLRMKEIPAVTEQFSRRVVKTPAKRVKRLVPALCNLNETRRKLVTPKTFVLYDAAKTEVARYENPEDVLTAISFDGETP